MGHHETWTSRYLAGWGSDKEPAGFLVASQSHLPREGRALDVAGGAGRHAVWLAQRGLDTTLVDFVEAGLDLARQRAAKSGVQIETICRNLEVEGPPDGPWDVIVVYHFLERSIMAALASSLAPGGVLLYCQPTVANLARNERPKRQFLLDSDELPALLPELEIVEYHERWWDNGRHEARYIGTRS